jgi:hypothetical protein
MKTIKMTLILAVVTALTFFLLSCSGETVGKITTAEPELTLGELPDYSDAHAEDAPYIVFSSDLEPISEERIEQVRKSFYSLLYKSEYAILKEIYDDDQAMQLSVQFAGFKSLLMNSDNLLYSDHYTWISNYTARYYGTVNGCEIICFSTFIDRDTLYEFGGVKIESPNPLFLFVCKENEMIPLAEAYENGWLEPIDILLIAKRNKDFNSYWEENCSYFKPGRSYVKYIPELEDMSEELMTEMYDCLYSDIWEKTYSSAVSKLSETHAGKYTAETIEARAAFDAERSEKMAQYSFLRNANTHSTGWRYYGIIGGYVVFAEVADTDNVKQYKLGEYEISFPNGAELWVYSAEKGIVEIDEAYKNGWLTDTDVVRIGARHQAYNEYIYKK